MKECVLGKTTAELARWFCEQKEAKFRAKQLVEWLYAKGEIDFAKMTNFSVELRQKLQEHFAISPIELVSAQDSSDLETTKFLWKLSDGNFVESVLIRSDDRRTVCVSSQVGCPARCAFCASGKEGLFRNLETSEIFAQVFLINNWLQKKNERVSHIVYMGMGEPFRNYENVVESIKLLLDPEFLGISQRRITVSTVGVVEGIKRFSDESFKVNLVLSLHAPNQRLRQKIIPYARHYELNSILEAMDEYAEKTKRDITFEYTLLAGLNDGKEEAEELVQLLKDKQCTVNLIPYNPVAGLQLKRPSPEVIREFRQVLDKGRIVNTCRYTKGDDIAAACGQLVLQKRQEVEGVKQAGPLNVL
jgi:23S rRNA (adenine2503-C2)-methyltransferase